MKKNRLPWIAGGAALLVAAYLGYRYWKKADPAPVWITAPATRDDVRVTVTATGTLKAVTTVEVGTQVSGTIAALYADFNSRVKKGQVIARLDTTLLYASLQDARSSLERVSALDQQASAELKRMRSLFERELVSQAELDQAVASARVAAANLTSARAGVQRARINLRYAIIQSPIDGIVLSRAVELGQTVAASFSTPTLFSLAGDLREMRVQAAVDEADIGKVKEGQQATFTVDAYPEETFRGAVEQVRLQPTVTQNVVTYDVVLRVPNDDLRLMPGMTANLTITVDAREDVLTVPVAALRFTPPRPENSGEGERAPRKTPGARGSRVFVLENGKPRRVAVETGLSDGARTEVRGDLKPGAPVITGAQTAEAKAGGAGAPFGMQPQRPRGMGGGGGGRRN
ncbi:MAG: Macrolide-specific efflux protein MacA [Fibrobacteria bacterium]|jgi:HlyD family secretion protein|nr:Macrolide-specific efflux protein MacA [Fibrobacteria bacterium]